jgi:uncharacterized RmlC-like cupin family protein
MTTTQNSFNEIVETQRMYGVKYYHISNPVIHQVASDQAYYFKTFVGLSKNDIDVEFGDCIYFFSEELKKVILKRGPCKVRSLHCATIIRGYMPSEMSVSLEGTTVLPYVNGCSTRQLMTPARPGDPTLQFLKIPPYSKEQAHHIHSTVRVVYVLEGKGKSVVGMEGKTVEHNLVPGTVCILDPMCPHHFETPYGQHIKVVPLHIYSSIGSVEAAHPMFHGTYMVNQGS